MRPNNPYPPYINSFDFMRLFAAIVVVYSHCFSLYGFADPIFLYGPSGSYINIGTVGVTIFFAISGYLVMQSLEQSRNIFHFMCKRVLRLYPALLLNYCLVLMVIIPITLQIGMSQYYTEIAHYFTDILLAFFTLSDFYLPSAFPGATPHTAINGSLWTLCLEVRCYLILSIIAYSKKLRELLPLWLAIYMVVAAQMLSSLVYMHIGTFFLAACCFIYRAVIPWRFSLAAVCVIVLAVMVYYNLYFIPAYIAAMTYLVLYAALRSPYLHHAARYGDFSYGIYIYAWPVQQTFALLSHYDHAIFWLYFLLVLVSTLLCAWISWHLAEAPALRLKRLFAK